MKTKDYISAAKKALGGISDYALAQELGLTRSAISQLVNGHTVMSNTTAAKVAEILELDPLKVIADMEIERGSDGVFWKRIREAAAVLLPVAIGGSLLAPSPAEASLQRVESPVYYVKLWIALDPMQDQSLIPLRRPA